MNNAKIKVSRKAFQNALRGAMDCNTNKHNDRIKIEVTASKLSVYGNYDMAIKVSMPCEADSDASLIISPSILFKIIGTEDDDDLILSTSESGLSVHSTGGVINLPADAGGWHWPDISEPVAGEMIALPASELADALTAMLPLVSKDNFQAVFKGISMTYESGRMILHASDSYRLGMAELPYGHPSEKTLRIIIDASFLKVLVKLIKGLDDISLQVNESYTVVRGNNLLVQLSHRSGEYPDVERIMKIEALATVEIPALEFRQVLTRATLFTTSDKNWLVDFKISVDGVVIDSSGELGNLTELVAGEGTGVLDLSMNAKLLLDMLGDITGTLKIVAAGSGKVIKIVADSRPNIEYYSSTLNRS